MKLIGFVILLAVIFIVAHAAGARFGPLTTSHSRVQYTGIDTGSGMPMHMGGLSTGANP